jgi:ABC-type transport system substrate-binding protein
MASGESHIGEPPLGAGRPVEVKVGVVRQLSGESGTLVVMSRSGGTASRVVRLLTAALVGVLVLAGCTNAPPPPLVPTGTGSSEIPKQKLNEVVVGVDDVAGSYNPHAMAGQSAITTALSSLLLPSVFRTAPDGSPQLDTTLMVSAQVTKTQPYTVAYTVRRDASWSDSAPIAAEDFVYLWQHMRTEPGVVDPAGYRLISDISSREGGKVVEVAFSKPYPGWRSLFSSLLPAHLLKDAPGGWGRALADSFPAAAGPFSIKSLDQPLGEVVLERNDRYWEKPTLLDRVVLRRSSQTNMVKALTDDDNQAALLRADAIASNMLAELAKTKPLTITTVPRAEVAQLLLRPASPRLADVGVRTAVVSALDRESLIAIASGNGPSAQLKADSQVVPPSKPGYTPTIPQAGPPAAPDPAAVERLLTAAGYARSALGQWVKDGQPLTLTIAAPAGVEPYVTIASQVQRQLITAGIAAKVVTPKADQLYGQDLAAPVSASGVESDNAVDIAVVPRVDTGDSATALASEFGCRGQTGNGSTPVPANLSGFCDQTVQPVIDAALTGQMLLSDALARIEPVLWQQAVSVPLFQVADVMAVLPNTSGVEAGAPFAGAFSGAPAWRRVDR